MQVQAMQTNLIKRGMTILELLVVVGVTGILTALLLAAVFHARESTRRIQCQNNLKQLGIALHNHHSTYRHFPPGSLNEWSWSVRLFPSLEQANSFEQLNLRIEPFAEFNNEKIAKRISFLQCPSDPESGSVYFDEGSTNLYYGLTNYLGSLNTDGEINRGMFDYSQPIRVSEVVDGTSQTLMVGERGIVKNAAGRMRSWWAWGGDSTIGAIEGLSKGGTHDSLSARHWWSHHDGGANFVFVDGSVHFLPYSISPEVFVALGTKDGGEWYDEFQ